MPTPSFQDVLGLLKKGMTLEAQEQIVALREEMMHLREENLVLKNENLVLKDEIQSLRKELAELSQSSLPSCPKCGRPSFSLKESERDRVMGVVGMFRRLYECTRCGFSENRLDKGTDR